MTSSVVQLATPTGPARAHLFGADLFGPAGPRGMVALGHGAGPSISTVDLVTARDTLVEEGWAVAVVEQPWLVAGRRTASPPRLLDEAWLAVLAALRRPGGALAGISPLVLAGRSAGARVACRTAGELGANAVLCLSFPLHPPGQPHRLRADELVRPVQAGLPVAVVQGDKDPFGTPGELTAYLKQVYAVPGTHTIPRSSAPAVATAVREISAGLREVTP